MKKLFAILMAAIMALSMVSFASADGNEYAITIWAPEEAVPLTKAQVEAFNASNELGVKFNVTVEPVSEANSATSMIQDVEAGADIFFFAQDQFARLVQAGALAKIDDETAAKIKAESSKWIKQQGTPLPDFHWQTGYGAFSVNPGETSKAVQYIANQEEHHRNRTFQEEFLLFLKKYNIPYDEKHLWDEP